MTLAVLLSIAVVALLLVAIGWAVHRIAASMEPNASGSIVVVIFDVVIVIAFLLYLLHAFNVAVPNLRG